MNDMMNGFHPAIPVDKSDSFGIQSRKITADDRLRIHLEQKRQQDAENKRAEQLNQEQLMVAKRHRIVLRERLIKICDLATKEQYLEWLTGFVAFDDIDPDTDKNKRRITDIVEKDFNHDGTFLLAHHGLHIPALYGGQSLKFLIPEDVQIETAAIGLNQFFYMDGFKTNGKYVPYYQDMES